MHKSEEKNLHDFMSSLERKVYLTKVLGDLNSLSEEKGDISSHLGLWRLKMIS